MSEGLGPEVAAFRNSGIFGVRLPTFSGRKRLQLVDGVTALVGPNGSGKSIALSGIRTALAWDDSGDARSKFLNSVGPSSFHLKGDTTLMEKHFEAFSGWEESFDSEWLTAIRSKLSIKVADDSVAFEGVDSPLLYFSFHDTEDLPLQKVSGDRTAEEITRTIPRNIEWESLADSDELSFESFVGRPLRTLRFNGQFPILGFAVPTQMESVEADLDFIREVKGYVRVLGELFAFCHLLSLEFYVMLGDLDDSYFKQFEQKAQRERLLDEDPVTTRAKELLHESIPRVKELVDDVRIMPLWHLAGGWNAIVVSELHEHVESEVPDWAPMVGFEIESDPHIWHMEVGEAATAVSEETNRLRDLLADIEIYECEFSPRWDNLYGEAQALVGIQAQSDSEFAFPPYLESFEEAWESHAVLLDEFVNQIFNHLLPTDAGLKASDDFKDFTTHGWSLERVLPVVAGWQSSVSISDSSDTTQRWAALALQLALWRFQEYHSWALGHPPVILIDEPERGLGSQAQEHLARGLRSLHDEYGFNFILATHSAAMISEPDTRIVVLPDFVEMPQPSKVELDELGFSVSELFAFYRFIVLVEGHHEEIILKELIGPELAKKRARILPYRGTSQLSSAALDDLFDFSGSKFVVTADNTRTDLFNKALAELRSPNFETGTGTQFDEIFADLTQEEHAIKSLLMKAHRAQKLDRIDSIVGLEAADILDCLPVATFTDAGTWEELRDAHQLDRSTGVKDTPNDFKKWLEIKHNVDFSDENLLSGVEQLDELPDFISQLLDAIS